MKLSGQTYNISAITIRQVAAPCSGCRARFAMPYAACEQVAFQTPLFSENTSFSIYTNHFGNWANAKPNYYSTLADEVVGRRC